MNESSVEVIDESLRFKKITIHRFSANHKSSKSSILLILFENNEFPDFLGLTKSMVCSHFKFSEFIDNSTKERFLSKFIVPFELREKGKIYVLLNLVIDNAPVRFEGMFIVDIFPKK